MRSTLLRFSAPKPLSLVIDSLKLATSFTVLVNGRACPVPYLERGNLRPCAAPAGWHGGSCPRALCPAPAPPNRREKKYMCPLDPSHPLSQRKVHVKVRNVSNHCIVSVELLLICGRKRPKHLLLVFLSWSLITTIFFCPYLCPPLYPPRCPLTQKSWCRPCLRRSHVGHFSSSRNTTWFFPEENLCMHYYSLPTTEGWKAEWSRGNHRSSTDYGSCT